MTLYRRRWTLRERTLDDEERGALLLVAQRADAPAVDRYNQGPSSFSLTPLSQPGRNGLSNKRIKGTKRGVCARIPL